MGASQGRNAESRIRRLKFHNSFVDDSGVLRHYFRRRGKRTTLRGPFGSEDFWQDYNACLGKVPAKPAKRPPARDGSFAALATAYYANPSYRNLAPSSRKNYKRVIDGFLVAHGHGLVSQFKREHVDIIIGAMADQPGAGIVLLKRIRTLIGYAIALKWIPHDPTAGATSYSSKEIHTWTDAELAQYEARWPSGTRQRLAYAQLLYTGQRGSDVHLMARTQIDGDTIEVQQEKTDQEAEDEKLVIPIHPDFQREMDLADKSHVVILTTAWGGPFSVKGFGQFVSKAIKAAKLPDRCKAHGLRKAAARRLAEIGCSAKQIQSITGHKSLSELERYVRKADQVKLARQAMGMLQEGQRVIEFSKAKTQ